MFGNIKGWGISGGIVVVVSLLIIFMGKPPPITPPTKTIPLALSSISNALKDADPKNLGIKSGGNDADAQDLYMKVIDDYKLNQFKYEKYSSAIKQLLVDKPEFLDWIVEAADCSKATLFAKNPQLIINYNNELDAIVALKQTGVWLDTLGLALVQSKPPDYKNADRYLRAAFILGERLYDERIRFEEFTAGTEVMTNAAYAMQKEAELKRDTARVEQLQAFEGAITDYKAKLGPVVQAISGIGGNPLSNAGDMFDIAENSKEPMWRVEATLKLGRMHYMDTVTPADQRGAVRELKKLADNADSFAVRTAAEKARDLKVEDFRKIGGGS